MAVHESTRDKSRASGIRLMESTWKELEAIQIRRSHPDMQTTLREAVSEYIANDRAPARRSAA